MSDEDGPLNLVVQFEFAAHRRGPVAQLGARMNGIHEVTGSIPVWSTILRSLALPRGASFGWQAGRAFQSATDVHRSAKLVGGPTNQPSYPFPEAVLARGIMW